jgi:hypothetical protein
VTVKRKEKREKRMNLFITLTETNPISKQQKAALSAANYFWNDI